MKIVTKSIRVPTNNERMADYFVKRLSLPEPIPSAYPHKWCQQRYEPDGVDAQYFHDHSYDELSRGF